MKFFRVYLLSALFLGCISCSPNSKNDDRALTASSTSKIKTSSSDQKPGATVTPVDSSQEGNEQDEVLLEDDQPLPVATLTYVQDVKPVVDLNCVSCHSVGGQAGNIPYETYDQVSAGVNAMIAATMSPDRPMPPEAAAEARAQIADILTAWAADGLVEDEQLPP